MHDYTNAIFYHLRASELNRGNDDLAATYNYENIARCCVKTQEYKKAIEYLQRSTQIRVNLKKYAESIRFFIRHSPDIRENRQPRRGGKPLLSIR